MLNTYTIRAIRIKNATTGQVYWRATAYRAATSGLSDHHAAASADSKQEACIQALQKAFALEASAS